ncbi:helix-turn-helix transcriptional regulator [Egicoccus sp. AB-alg6-2]|uniref:helix-turn-helix transcriptional regulator n=1 Tax=Egicoccus sp. AB-alg6-2 TaxID=3242692 RepID=UPI00359CD5E7
MTERNWTFLTNHGHALVCISRDPDIRIRDIADRIGITERAAQSIVADLVAAEYVVRHRVGRRNRYDVNLDRPLRHQLEADSRVGELLGVLEQSRTAVADDTGSSGVG